MKNILIRINTIKATGINSKQDTFFRDREEKYASVQVTSFSQECKGVKLKPLLVKTDPKNYRFASPITFIAIILIEKCVDQV